MNALLQPLNHGDFERQTGSLDPDRAEQPWPLPHRRAGVGLGCGLRVEERSARKDWT